MDNGIGLGDLLAVIKKKRESGSSLFFIPN